MRSLRWSLLWNLFRIAHLLYVYWHAHDFMLVNPLSPSLCSFPIHSLFPLSQFLSLSVCLFPCSFPLLSLFPLALHPSIYFTSFVTILFGGCALYTHIPSNCLLYILCKVIKVNFVNVVWSPMFSSEVLFIILHIFNSQTYCTCLTSFIQVEVPIPREERGGATIKKRKEKKGHDMSFIFSSLFYISYSGLHKLQDC